MSTKKKVIRTVMVLLAIAIFMGAIYLILVLTGWWDSINSVEKLKKIILELGFWGRFMFVLLQFLQVTFIPLPSPVIVIAGTLIYGPFQASLLSLAGILLGSAVAFFLGRVCGKKLVVFMVGKQTCDKWVKFLNHGKYSFVIMMLLPLFPDDILCLVAGLTDMSWLFFIVTQLISRPIGIFLTSYFSDLIPYHGWGLIVWGLVFTFAIIAIYLSTKYQEEIEGMLTRLFKRKKS